jgi:cation diffusion facilitator CzcD-associated flavoprotein CzcO
VQNGGETLSKGNIAIIGAGACGICAAKVMKDAGFDVTVYEIGSKIGGMWCLDNDNKLSSAYRTLHINTSRNVTRFPELDFEDDVQPFPDHKDMHRYLQRYADHFGITPLIRFNSRVTQVAPERPDQPQHKRWLVTTDNDDTKTYNAVIAASGHLHLPRHAAELKGHFTGEYLHSHQYKAPEPYVGKRICIVGVGNSACDIAGDVCVNAERCVLVARSGVLILPKLFCGKPFTDITSKLQRRWIPYSVRRSIIKLLTWIVHGDMQKLGFKKPDKRVHVNSNGTIINDIAYRRITVKQGIDSIDNQTITFNDGSSETFDVLIAATGYKTDLPFLSPEIVPIGDNQMDLYQRIVPPHWPGLYLLGFFNTDTALNAIFRHQAQWVREIELGNATLPDASTMTQAVKDRRAWLSQHYRQSPRHHLEEESVPYIKALEQSMQAMRAN